MYKIIVLHITNNCLTLVSCVSIKLGKVGKAKEEARLDEETEVLITKGISQRSVHMRMCVRGSRRDTPWLDSRAPLPVSVFLKAVGSSGQLSQGWDRSIINIFSE